MRGRVGRDRRARRGRYFLRDLAGFADIARLLANNVVGGRLPPDAIDDDDPGDLTVSSTTPPARGSIRNRP